jgi:hypothetical protein
MDNMLSAFELEARQLDPDDPWNELLQDVHLELGVNLIKLYKLPQVN